MATLVQNQLDLVADSRVERIESFVYQTKEGLALVASRTQFREYLRQNAGDPGNVPGFQENTRRILEDAKSVTTKFQDLMMTAPNGQIVAASQDSFLGQNLSANPDFQHALKGFHMALPQWKGGQLQALAYTPVTIGNNEFLGVLVARVNLDGLLPLLEGGTEVWQSGDVLVGRKEGDNIQYLVPPREAPANGIVPSEKVPILAVGKKLLGGCGMDGCNLDDCSLKPCPPPCCTNRCCSTKHMKVARHFEREVIGVLRFVDYPNPGTGKWGWSSPWTPMKLMPNLQRTPSCKYW